MDNIWFIGSLFFNIFLIFIIAFTWKLFGPFYKDSLIVSLGLMKDPNLFVVFGQSRRLGLEWRPFASLQNSVKGDKTSEIVLVDRTQDSQVGSYVNKRGIFNLFQNKVPRNNVYEENGVFVNFDNNKDFRSFGYPAHVILQGTNKTINPLDSIKQDPKARLSSFAIIEAIEGWKTWYANKFQTEMLTTKVFLIATFFLIFLLFLNLVFTFNTSGTVDAFKQAFEHYKPIIEQAVQQFQANAPRAEPGA